MNDVHYLTTPTPPKGQPTAPRALCGYQPTRHEQTVQTSWLSGFPSRVTCPICRQAAAVQGAHR